MTEYTSKLNAILQWHSLNQAQERQERKDLTKYDLGLVGFTEAKLPNYFSRRI